MGVPIVRSHLLKQPHLHLFGFEPNRAKIFELGQNESADAFDFGPKHLQISAEIFPKANKYDGRSLATDCKRKRSV